ncbi:MAG: HTH domain-containing protein [Candidatus Aenigmarchaeota archaeon]|nr:HTH domain-containing protein [Candidatus Aenigmarchaeota archaeon]
MIGVGIGEKIIKLISKHDYGLTIEEIASSLGINRMTASKYLAVLEATGDVKVREVGKAKLHYPKDKKDQKWLKLNSRKSSCGMNNIGAISLLFFFFMTIIIFITVTTATPDLIENNVTLTEDVDIYLSTGGPTGRHHYVYIEFNISSLPDYSSIDFKNATLVLTRSQAATDNGDIDIYRVNNQNCNVTSDDYSVLDGYATANQTQFAGLASTADGQDIFNITTIFKEEWQAGNPKLCLRIQDPDKATGTPNSKSDISATEVHTGENDGDPARFWYTKQGTTPPYLTAVYEDSPPNASLGTNPVAYYNDSDGSITFDLKCYDNLDVDTVKLYGNWSGWHANQTNSSPVNDVWWNVTVDGIPEGTWKWGVWCNDTIGQEDWSDVNRTFTVETCNVNFTMTNELQLGIRFGNQDPGVANVSAIDNGNYNITDTSTSACGTVNVSIRATDDLVNGSSKIGIGNVTVNSTSPSSETIQLSTTYQLIRSGVPAGENNVTTLYFWLTVPSGQEPQYYNTTIYIMEEME